MKYLLILAMIFVFFSSATVKELETEGEIAMSWVARVDTTEEDIGTDIVVDRENNVFVTGTTGASNESKTYTTLKYNPEGVLCWQRDYDLNIDLLTDNLKVIIPNPEIVLDETRRAVYISGMAEYKLLIVAYDMDTGEMLWDFLYSTLPPGDLITYANGIAIDRNGNIFATGYTYLVSYGCDAFLTVKVNPAGDTLWTAAESPENTYICEAIDIAVDRQGCAFVTGFADGIGYEYDYLTVKYDPEGNRVWKNSLDGFGGTPYYVDVPAAIAVDSSRNVIVTGCSSNLDGSRRYFNTVKYDSNGELLWTRVDHTYTVNALAIDKQDNIFVTGKYSNAFCTRKYSTNGDSLWTAFYHPPDSYFNESFDIAIDSNGLVVVTGASGKTPEDELDYSTVWYTNSSGIELQSMSYTGEEIHGEDSASCIATDRFGNVYVSGYSEGPSQPEDVNLDYLTIKYLNPVISINPIMAAPVNN